MNNNSQNTENLTPNEQNKQGEALLKQYAELATTPDSEEEHSQGCGCCQDKNR